MKTCAKAPCKTCPYRKDVPSGLWAASEYKKLKEFDAPLAKQPPARFDCHQRDGMMCAGWIATHRPENLLALRLTEHNVHSYTSPVPVFKSGTEAAKHGMRDIKRPKDAARKAIERLTRKSKDW